MSTRYKAITRQRTDSRRSGSYALRVKWVSVVFYKELVEYYISFCSFLFFNSMKRKVNITLFTTATFWGRYLLAVIFSCWDRRNKKEERRRRKKEEEEERKKEEEKKKKMISSCWEQCPWHWTTSLEELLIFECVSFSFYGVVHTMYF